jgi:hypothetical protein
MNGSNSCQLGIVDLSWALCSWALCRLCPHYLTAPAYPVPATLRYAAICGSADEMGVQPCAVTIWPLFGVVV